MPLKKPVARQESMISASMTLDIPLLLISLWAGVDLVTVRDLLGHAGINMTVRYSHLVPEHKAQAVAKLEERFKAPVEQTQAQSAVVSPELKEAINAVLPPKLEENRNIFLARRGRGLGIVNEIEDNMEAASGFEPLHRGFADLSLNHLGTPPYVDR
jgi:hypothetical protein